MVEGSMCADGLGIPIINKKCFRPTSPSLPTPNHPIHWRRTRVTLTPSRLYQPLRACLRQPALRPVTDSLTPALHVTYARPAGRPRMPPSLSETPKGFLRVILPRDNGFGSEKTGGGTYR